MTHKKSKTYTFASGREVPWELATPDLRRKDQAFNRVFREVDKLLP